MRKSILVSVGLGLALAACQDAAGPDGDRLSRVEALQLVAQVMAQSEGAAGAAMTVEGGATGAPDAAGVPTNFTHTHTSTHPCPSGGQLAVDFVLTGSFDEETQSLQADLTGSHVHASCAFPHSGVTFTVSGEPSVGFTASVGAVNGVPSQPFTFTLDGALRWETSDGRSGLCQLELDAVTDFAAQERTVQGAVCGHTITETTTWS